jgi:hypothetical protein
MEENSFHELQLLFLKKLERKVDVAELLYSMSRLVEASQYVLAELWDRLSFGHPYKSDNGVKRLLKVASGLIDRKRVSRTDRDEVHCICSLLCLMF